MIKRFVCLILCIISVICSTFCSFGCLASYITRGDVNNDGALDMKDCLVIRQILAGCKVACDFSSQNADVNEDGLVNLKDVLSIRMILMDDITSPLKEATILPFNRVRNENNQSGEEAFANAKRLVEGEDIVNSNEWSYFREKNNIHTYDEIVNYFYNIYKSYPSVGGYPQPTWEDLVRQREEHPDKGVFLSVTNDQYSDFVYLSIVIPNLYKK